MNKKNRLITVFSLMTLFVFVFVGCVNSHQKTDKKITPTYKASIHGKTFPDILKVTIPSKYSDFKEMDASLSGDPPVIDVSRKCGDITLRFFIRENPEPEDKTLQNFDMDDMEGDNPKDQQEIIVGEESLYVYTTSREEYNEELGQNVEFKDNCVETGFSKGKYCYYISMESSSKSLTQEERNEFCKILKTMKFLDF